MTCALFSLLCGTSERLQHDYSNENAESLEPLTTAHKNRVKTNECLVSRKSAKQYLFFGEHGGSTVESTSQELIGFFTFVVQPSICRTINIKTIILQYLN